MEFSVKTAKLTTLLESRITNFYTNFQVDEIGRVVSVGDGIARAKNPVHSVSLILMIQVFLGRKFMYKFFCSLPFIKGQPQRRQNLFFFLAESIAILILSKLVFAFCCLFMDELQRAVAQFLPSGSGGMNLGSGEQAPLPSPSDPFFPVSQEPEEDQPGDSHRFGHQQTAVGQQKMEKVLERHLRTHCQTDEIRQKYPQLASAEVDYGHLAKKMAISHLDCDTKTDVEIGELASAIGRYAYIQSLIADFVKKEFENEF